MSRPTKDPSQRLVREDNNRVSLKIRAKSPGGCNEGEGQLLDARVPALGPLESSNCVVDRELDHVLFPYEGGTDCR